jgi:hypothetical protein
MMACFGERMFRTAETIALRRAIAWHPGQQPGCRRASLLFFNPEDDAAALIRRPNGSPVTSMTFSVDGKSFGYGCESGPPVACPREMKCHEGIR